MAYKTEEILKKSIKAIKDLGLVFIEDVCVSMGISKKTFYTHKLHESDELRNLLEYNIINNKIKLRKKWLESDNATLQLALYKLIGTTEERKKLCQTYMDLTNDGDKFDFIGIDGNDAINRLNKLLADREAEGSV
jgi:hypothetical protein